MTVLARSGSSTGGPQQQLQLLGAVDRYLYLNPKTSNFRWRYQRTTNVAFETIALPFASQPVFGGDAEAQVTHIGDAALWACVIYELPGIMLSEESSTSSSRYPRPENPAKPWEAADMAFFRAAAGGGDPEDGRRNWLAQQYGGAPELEVEDEDAHDADVNYVHWANSIGHVLTKQARLTVGGSPVDNLWREYLHIWSEHTDKSGNEQDDLIGKFDPEDHVGMINFARRDQRLYVSLPFAFSELSGNALPLAGMHYHTVSIWFTFASLEECVVINDNGLDGGRLRQVVKCRDGQALTPHDLRVALDITYVFYDVEEREVNMAGGFLQLITQVQRQDVQVSSAHVDVHLNFNHPVLEFFVVARREVNAQANHHFNFSGVDGKDPIEMIGMNVNNMPRFAPRPADWFRKYVPFKHHSSRAKDNFVYNICFALKPEMYSPSGSLNMSRAESAMMSFDMQSALQYEHVKMMIFARNFQIFRVERGLGGIGFYT